MSEGLIIGYQTTDDTVPIAVNRILTRDSDGDVVATTVPGVDVPIVGVSSGAVAARTTSSQKDIPVKTQGLARVPKPTDLAMKVGFIVTTNGTTTVGTDNGSTCIMATTATTLAGGYKDLGRVARDAATTDTEVLIALNIR